MADAGQAALLNASITLGKATGPVHPSDCAVKTCSSVTTREVYFSFGWHTRRCVSPIQNYSLCHTQAAPLVQDGCRVSITTNVFVVLECSLGGEVLSGSLGSWSAGVACKPHQDGVHLALRHCVPLVLGKQVLTQTDSTVGPCGDPDEFKHITDTKHSYRRKNVNIAWL